jgi:polar amino acid transport system substrate-binding protein
MKNYLSLTVLTIAVVALLAVVATPKADAGSAGYYTAAQATSGAKLYGDNCSRCHGAKLEGVSAPALKGSGMAGSQSIADIYGFVSQQMPAGAPGSLSPTVYASIMAFILKENGHPAGDKPLTAASAKTIKAKI